MSTLRNKDLGELIYKSVTLAPRLVLRSDAIFIYISFLFIAIAIPVVQQGKHFYIRILPVLLLFITAIAFLLLVFKRYKKTSLLTLHERGLTITYGSECHSLSFSSMHSYSVDFCDYQLDLVKQGFQVAFSFDNKEEHSSKPLIVSGFFRYKTEEAEAVTELCNRISVELAKHAKEAFPSGYKVTGECFAFNGKTLDVLSNSYSISSIAYCEKTSAFLHIWILGNADVTISIPAKDKNALVLAELVLDHLASHPAPLKNAVQAHIYKSKKKRLNTPGLGKLLFSRPVSPRANTIGLLITALAAFLVYFGIKQAASSLSKDNLVGLTLSLLVFLAFLGVTIDLFRSKFRCYERGATQHVLFRTTQIRFEDVEKMTYCCTNWHEYGVSSGLQLELSFQDNCPSKTNYIYHNLTLPHHDKSIAELCDFLSSVIADKMALFIAEGKTVYLNNETRLKEKGLGLKNKEKWHLVSFADIETIDCKNGVFKLQIKPNHTHSIPASYPNAHPFIAVLSSLCELS